MTTEVLSLTGVIVIAVVFSYPGLGHRYVNAVAARDYLFVQRCILVSASALVVDMLTGIAYGITDPRIRYE